MLDMNSPTIHDMREVGCKLSRKSPAARRRALWAEIAGCPGAGLAGYDHFDDVTQLALKFYFHPRHPDPRA